MTERGKGRGSVVITGLLGGGEQAGEKALRLVLRRTREEQWNAENISTHLCHTLYRTGEHTHTHTHTHTHSDTSRSAQRYLIYLFPHGRICCSVARLQICGPQQPLDPAGQILASTLEHGDTKVSIFQPHATSSSPQLYRHALSDLQRNQSVKVSTIVADKRSEIGWGSSPIEGTVSS